MLFEVRYKKKADVYHAEATCFAEAEDMSKEKHPNDEILTITNIGCKIRLINNE